MSTPQNPSIAPSSPEDSGSALRVENQRRLWRFVDRVTRRLSDDDIMDVMVEEFMLELKAERVGYVVAEESDIGWNFAVSHEAAVNNVNRLPIPYMVAQSSSADFYELLATAVEKEEPEVRAWRHRVEIKPETQFEAELQEEFQAALEQEFGLARSVNCCSAMACAVETTESGRVLFCVQRVEDRAPWTQFQQELFSEMCHYAGSMLDQTKLSEQVRELKDRFSSLIESMPSAIVGLDLLGTVSMWNSKAEILFGIAEEKAVGHPFWKLLPEFGFVEEGINKLLQKTPGANLEFELLPYSRRGARRLYLRATLFTLFGSDRGELALRIDDATNAEELRQKLSVSQRRELQGALLTASGHELQNLMMAAQGRLWLLEKEIESANIHSNITLGTEIEGLKLLCSRSVATLGRLLTISGDAPEGPARFEMRDAVREAVELCRKVFGAKLNVFLREFEGNSEVNADRYQLEQAILNVLLQARGNLNEGVLVVSLEPDTNDQKQRIRLRVEAKGSGLIRKEEENSTSILGWTIAQALAEQSGGTSSEEITSEGSHIYTLAFPIAVDFVANQKTIAPEVKISGRILVVQADDALRETYVRLLSAFGCDVEDCADGASAIKRMESNRAIDLAVIDWDLPVLNGKDTAVVLRARQPNLHLIFRGAPAKMEADNIPQGAVFLPRTYGIPEFAQAVRKALTQSYI